MQYDVFNGDADGICALHQLRLADPRPEAELITGVKRDVKLLNRLIGKAGSNDQITVLDLSLSSNKDSLEVLLDTGCEIFYADHHFSGDIPPSNKLITHIDPSPEICTSLIIDRLLAGKFRAWAVVGAFGDNLHQAATQAATKLSLSEDEIGKLRELGELLNYNGYGSELVDLHYNPEDLYIALHAFVDPFDFYNESDVLACLRQGFKDDMTKARSQKSYAQSDVGRIFQFPAQSWSKRVAGVFSNEIARERPELAHALLVDNGDDTYLISVRSPLNNRVGADDLCRSFPTGGGRAAAAGINALPNAMVNDFLTRFNEVFS